MLIVWLPGKALGSSPKHQPKLLFSPKDAASAVPSDCAARPYSPAVEEGYNINQC